MQTTDFLTNLRRTYKLHELMLKQISEAYGLSFLEVNIICFLHNNPTHDTAGDIVELRMLSKGNVSQAVESLIQKSLLMRKADTRDRRKIHLALLPAANPIVDAIDKGQKEFQEEIFYGLSAEELTHLEELHCRMMENTKRALKRKEQK